MSRQAVFKNIGASNHTNEVRQIDDYYATEPKAVRLLLELETFGNVWECACGEGHLSKEIEKTHKVISTDKYNRGFGTVFDFFECEKASECDIITNPPYKYANEFILHAMKILDEGRKVALFLPQRYLEGKKRGLIFREYPPKIMYASSGRLRCGKNGSFENCSSAVGFAWFVWIKGYQGETTLRWFN